MKARNGEITLRPCNIHDLPEAKILLDEALGVGFWSLDPSDGGLHRVALAGDRIVGLGSAALLDTPLQEAPGLPLPCGLIRTLAVDPGYRGCGIGSRLAQALHEACTLRGAASLAAFAWVQHLSGKAQIAGILEHLGFRRIQRIQGFYAHQGAPSQVQTPCPGCGERVCICAADVYTWESSLARTESGSHPGS